MRDATAASLEVAAPADLPVESIQAVEEGPCEGLLHVGRDRPLDDSHEEEIWMLAVSLSHRVEEERAPGRLDVFVRNEAF